MRKKIRLYDVAFKVLLLIIVFSVLVPLLNLIASSLTTPENISSLNPWSIIPKGFTTIYYEVVFSNSLIKSGLLNSIFITGVHIILSVVFTSLAAYALTRPELRFKRFFMAILIVVMVFEPGIIQEYFVVKSLNLDNTRTVLILYNVVNVYYLIIMMRFFEDVPKEIFESAKMDGANHIQIYSRIMLPLAKPSIITIGMFYGVAKWNEFFRASIYITDINKYPLQLVLRKLVVQNDIQLLIGTENLFSYGELAKLDYGSLQAATIIVSLIPILILFPFVLRFYVKNQFSGSDK